MANLKYRVTKSRDGWEVIDPVTEKVLRTYILPDESDVRHNLLLVGGKSTFHDGGAADKGTPLATRLAMFDKRWQAVIDGTWRFNDGRGGSAKTPRFPRPELFAAVVACGHLKDTPDNRKLWIGATEITFAKAYRQEGVMEYLEKHAPADNSGLFADPTED